MEARWSKSNTKKINCWSGKSAGAQDAPRASGWSEVRLSTVESIRQRSSLNFTLNGGKAKSTIKNSRSTCEEETSFNPIRR
jgi:hypothetical protein